MHSSIQIHTNTHGLCPLYNHQIQTNHKDVHGVSHLQLNQVQRHIHAQGQNPPILTPDCPHRITHIHQQKGHPNNHTGSQE